MSENEVEIWKDIEGFEGLYQISNFGRVKSLARYLERKKHKHFRKESMLYPTLSTQGYIRVCLYNKRRYMKVVHRLLAIAFIPNPNNLPQVNHKNGIRNDIRLENLEWVTSYENNMHAIHVLNRKILKGTEIGNSKLNPEIIKELKFMKQFYSYTKLQDIYGINRATIHLAVTGKTWKHLIEENND